MAKRRIYAFCIPSLRDLCLIRLIEEIDHYPPEMLNLLPSAQRKELLLYCPVVSICRLEQTCAFNGIDSDMFWYELLRNQCDTTCRPTFRFEIKELLRLISSNREKYFTYLTTMIFSVDRFSGDYARIICSGPQGSILSPEQHYDHSCPDVDIVNYLVACRKPNVHVYLEEVENEEQFSETDTTCSSEEGSFISIFDPAHIHNIFRMKYDEFYKRTMKGQYVGLYYSHYISKENDYRLFDDDAVSLIMNECNYYPKKLYMQEYEHMHWKWNDEDLIQLLTQFFSRLESLSLHFRQKGIDDGIYSETTTSDSKKGLELVIKCCFRSPVLSSLAIADPETDDRTAFFPTEPCPSLSTLDIRCWSPVSNKSRTFEAYANITSSHCQLTEISLHLAYSMDVSSSSFSRLYSSLIGFVQRCEFSKLSLHELLPFSTHLRCLLNVFLRTPCSQPQEINLYQSEPDYMYDEVTVSSVDFPVGEIEVPSGALKYKCLFVHGAIVTADFCDWLFSHQPLVLKTFHIYGRVVNFGKYGTFVSPETPIHTQILCDNVLFQTQNLSLTLFNDFPWRSFQNLLHQQQLTNLSLFFTERQRDKYQNVCKPKSWSINAITSILLNQVETLTELEIVSNDEFDCYNISIESSADMERFGDALFSLRNYEIFSLDIPVIWKKDDASCIDSLYKSWQKHGCRKLKTLNMGRCECGFGWTDELRRRMYEMGLDLFDSSVCLNPLPSPTVRVATSDSDHMNLSSSSKHVTLLSLSSLHDLCLSKLIEEFHCYSPEMLSILPPIQRKELLLYCPVVSICHLEQTCAFNGIDFGIFWSELLRNHKNRLGSYPFNDIKADEALLCASHSHDYENYCSSSREKYFTYLTAIIFSGDRFSGHFAWFTGMEQHYLKNGYAPPGERNCPHDIVNYLVAHRKLEVVEEVNSERESSSPEKLEFYYPVPIRDMLGRKYGELYTEATKGQHVHSCYSQYILKENDYRLSDEDAVALMMNECRYYPKKLFIHEYEEMHWKWSEESLIQLLTQFFSKLESLSLCLKSEKAIDDYTYMSTSGKYLELVLNCCFNSPALTSLVIADPVRYHSDRTALYSMLATKPCQSLRKLDIHCWKNSSDRIRHLEAYANIISSHSQLTDICLRLDSSLEVPASSLSNLYTSLIGFVQKLEFSSLSLHEKLPYSPHLRHLISAFLTTPCSQPQEIHVYISRPDDSKAFPIDLPVGNDKIPSGALEYKSLFVHEHCIVPVDFCEWLCSHQPLVLKVFHFDGDLVNIRESGGWGPSGTAFPLQLLCDNAVFQTKELLLPIVKDIPLLNYQKLLYRQQLISLSLSNPEQFQQSLESNPWNINDITNILSLRADMLTEFSILWNNKYKHYRTNGIVCIESSDDIEHFGDTLFSLQNCETLSLSIPVIWKAKDVVYIDSLYKSWLKHGCRKLKSFKMGDFEYGFVLTDELARKLHKMGLIIQNHEYTPSNPYLSSCSDDSIIT